MKTKLIVLFTFICMLSYSQDAPKSKTYLGIYYSPDLTSVISDDLENTFLRFGNTIGGSIGIKFNNLLGMEFGLQYSIRGYQEGLYYLGDGGVVPYYNVKLKTAYKYLGVPLKITLTKKINNFSLMADVGVIANFFIDKETVAIYDYGDHTRKRTFNKEIGKKATLTSVISAGFGFDITPSIVFTFQPMFQRDLISLSNSSDIYLWNFGLKTGFIFKI